MRKLMDEHRRRFGSIEAIEFDLDQVERLRRRLDVSVDLDARWTWEYASEVEALRNLYAKGKTQQWNADSDLDWSTPVTSDAWVISPETSLLAQALAAMGRSEEVQRRAAFDEVAYTLSQLLHGEQAALHLCGQLTNACSKMDEKWYAAVQVIDEARHIEALAAFAGRKLGGIHAIEPALKVLLEALIEQQAPRMKILGMQCLFEGIAVGIFDMLRRASRNPLLTLIRHSQVAVKRPN